MQDDMKGAAVQNPALFRAQHSHQSPVLFDDLGEWI